MRTLDIILLVVAAACLVVSVINPEPVKKHGYQLNLVAAGLLAWVLVPLIALLRAG